MAHCYKFAIVRLAPDDARGERINIGALVLNGDSIDVRITKRLEKVRAISGAIDLDKLRSLITNFKTLDLQGRSIGVPDDERFDFLSKWGPISLSAPGSFLAHDLQSYETRISTIMTDMVECEPAPLIFREKRSRLLTQMKSSLRQERILGKKDDPIECHRIVPSYKLDVGIVADLVLKNGSMHIIETIDASNNDEPLRKAIGDIAMAAHVFECARNKYGFDGTKGRLVYIASSALESSAKVSLDTVEKRGAILTNWSSAQEQKKFLREMYSLAIPFEDKRKRKSAAHQRVLPQFS